MLALTVTAAIACHGTEAKWAFVRMHSVKAAIGSHGSKALLRPLSPCTL